MTKKVFAPEFQKDSHGWYLFPPNDSKERVMFFPEDALEHPAKLNFHLQQALIEYLTEPGETILDPTSGTGTLMIAALQKRRVILLEIEEKFHELQQRGKSKIKEAALITEDAQWMEENIILLQGDCRFLLPITCNHVMFSPPYAQAMNIKKVREQKEGRDDYFVKQDRMMLEYSKSPRNISKLNPFLYSMEMEKIYRQLVDSILPGGTLTVVIKDRINNGERTFLSHWVNKVAILQCGMEMKDWFKWKAPGVMFTNVRRSQGEEVVDDEDILVYRKPS
jgi:hypothetical protein